MPIAYMGIDAGTTAIKVLIVGETGTVLSEGESELPISVPEPGWSEQDPEDWWNGVVQAVRQAVSNADEGTEIAAIGLSGQMHSLVALDGADRVIRPAILWNDARTAAECREIEERLGIDGLRRYVGNPALEGFTAPKLMWMAKHEPENFARIRTVLLPKDYIRLRLCGVKAMEPSDSAGTLMFDIVSGSWSRDAMEALELNPDWMPEIVGSAEVSGGLTRSSAMELGLPVGTPVVGGGADNASAALGSGVTAPGTMMVSIGTGGTVVAPIAEPAVDEDLRLHTFNHAVPDTWYLMGVVLAAGSALAWWRSQLTGGGETPSFESLVQEAGATAPGCDGLTFLPYLTGNRTPHADASARGAFIGLHAGHDRAHMTCAVMEGVTFSLLDSYRLIRELASEPTELVGTSGGMRSVVWRQMVADSFGVPVATVPSSGSPYGAAILAACGAGLFASPIECADTWVQRIDSVDPVSSRNAAYQEAYGRFRSLYPRLKDHF